MTQISILHIREAFLDPDQNEEQEGERQVLLINTVMLYVSS